MFEAHKDSWIKWLAIRSNGMGIRCNFAGVHVQGDLAALANDDRATLYFANHVSVWDGAIAGYLSHTYLRQDPFIMTAEDGMSSRETWNGTFSVSRQDHFSATQSLRYSVRLLREVPRCALWIYPQGVILPFYRRPLSFRKGTAIILSQVKEVRLVPVAFYYTIVRHSKPEAFVSFGEPLDLASKANLSQLTNQLEECLSKHLDKLGNNLSNGNTQSFQTLIHGLNIQEYIARLEGKPLIPLKTWGSPQQSVEGSIS